MYDVVYLGYKNEINKKHYDTVLNYVPYARWFEPCGTILESHKNALMHTFTEYVFVIDADNIVIKNIFDYVVKKTHDDEPQTVIWYSKNPINGLEYGHGGIKLFHRKSLLLMGEKYVDMTLSVTPSFVTVIPEVASIHKYDVDEFSVWATAFREVVKLSFKYAREDIERFETWCEKRTDHKLIDFSLDGAMAGKEYAEECFYNDEMLTKINDFHFLKELFSQRFKRDKNDN